MKYVIIATVLASISAQAFGAEYKQYFTVHGKEVSAEEAILSSLKGGEAFKCVSVQASVSKSGTSIGIKNVKKPRKN